MFLWSDDWYRWINFTVRLWNLQNEDVLNIYSAVTLFPWRRSISISKYEFINKHDLITYGHVKHTEILARVREVIVEISALEWSSVRLALRENIGYLFLSMIQKMVKMKNACGRVGEWVVRNVIFFGIQPIL